MENIRSFMSKSLSLIIAAVFVIFALASTSLADESSKELSVTQTGAASDSVSIKWKAARPDPSFYSYILYFEDNSNITGDSNITQFKSYQTSDTAYTFTGLKPGHRYTCVVLGIYEVGDKDYVAKDLDDEATYYNTDLTTLPAKTTRLAQDGWYWESSKAGLVWADQDGADGYEYEVSYNGKVCAKGTVTSNTFSYKTKKNRICTFRVRAYCTVNGDKKYGAWSKSGYIIPQPMTTRITYTKDGLKIKWNKVNGVSRYRIYASTKQKSGYKLIKTVKADVTSLTFKKIGTKKIKKSGKYYIRIAAEKSAGGKRYSSSIVSGTKSK